MENVNDKIEWVKIKTISGSEHIIQKQMIIIAEGYQCQAPMGQCERPVHYSFLAGPLQLEVTYDEAVRVWDELGISYNVPTFETAYKGLVS